eukprot:6301632-Prymnesium_polylepis.1
MASSTAAAIIGRAAGAALTAAAPVVAAAAVGVCSQVMDRAQPAPPPPPPPPTVWCVTLRRMPPLTKEDQPPITDGEKCCLQCLLYPPACAAHAAGYAYCESPPRKIDKHTSPVSLAACVCTSLSTQCRDHDDRERRSVLRLRTPSNLRTALLLGARKSAHGAHPARQP